MRHQCDIRSQLIHYRYRKESYQYSLRVYLMTSLVSNLILLAAIVRYSQFGGFVEAYVNERSHVRVSPLTRSTSSSLSSQQFLRFDINREEVDRCQTRNSLSSTSLPAQSTYNSDDSRIIAPPATNQNLHRPMKVMGKRIRCYSRNSPYQIIILLRQSTYMCCCVVDWFKLLLLCCHNYCESS